MAVFNTSIPILDIVVFTKYDQFLCNASANQEVFELRSVPGTFLERPEHLEHL